MAVKKILTNTRLHHGMLEEELERLLRDFDFERGKITFRTMCSQTPGQPFIMTFIRHDGKIIETITTAEEETTIEETHITNRL